MSSTMSTSSFSAFMARSTGPWLPCLRWSSVYCKLQIKVLSRLPTNYNLFYYIPSSPLCRCVCSPHSLTLHHTTTIFREHPLSKRKKGLAGGRATKKSRLMISFKGGQTPCTPDHTEVLYALFPPSLHFWGYWLLNLSAAPRSLTLQINYRLKKEGSQGPGKNDFDFKSQLLVINARQLLPIIMWEWLTYYWMYWRQLYGVYISMCKQQ